MCHDMDIFYKVIFYEMRRKWFLLLFLGKVLAEFSKRKLFTFFVSICLYSKNFENLLKSVGYGIASD